MKRIKELIKENTHKYLGQKMSSDAAFRIHTVQLGLQLVGTLVELAERAVVALEAIARGGSLPGPSEADRRAARKAAREAELAELEAKRAELAAEEDDDSED
jgi:hypothetical protein